MSDIYLVRRAATDDEKKVRPGRWRYISNEGKWTYCQYCAWRFGRGEAHQIAHAEGPGVDVVRLVPKR